MSEQKSHQVRPIYHFINGESFQGTSQEFGDIINPSTGQVIAQVAYAHKDDADAAVLAAKNAFTAWADTPPASRAKILFRWRQLLEDNQEALVHHICQEHGKSPTEAIGSLMRGMDVLEFTCGIPTHLKGEFSANVGRNIDSFSMRQPLGVVVAITPFNFPIMVALWLTSVAIACGNTVILKASEKNPSAALLMAELAVMAGFPKGVLNILNGTQKAVKGLITHPDVAAVSFVGQTSTAKYIQETAINHGKRVQAFGAAKNHALIMPDADLDQAVDAIIGAAYGSAGERCMAISVVVAVGDVCADYLVHNISQKAKILKIGAPLDPQGKDFQSEMGPLISQYHREKVLGYIEKGIYEGATLVVDGRDIDVPSPGYFLGASLFDHVTPEMSIYQDEIFGPVLCVVRVKSYEEGLELINAHPYANGVAIFTRDGDSARDFCQRIQVGMVGVNVPIPVPVGYLSFGGWKASCFADHGMHGMEGVRFFTKLKTVTSRWPSGIRSGIEFSLPTVE